jgi:hypothetical protein
MSRAIPASVQRAIVARQRSNALESFGAGDQSMLRLDPESLVALAAEMARMASTSGGLLDAEGAGQLLSVPASWLLAEARRDRVPHVRLGRRVRFDRDDLLGWAAARSRGPRPRRTGSGPVSRGGEGQ